MDLETKLPALGLENAPARGEDQSLRMAVEAHAPEVVGAVPVYDDVVLVVSIVLIFTLINAVWSAGEGTVLGLLRRALRGNRIDGLFLGVTLRPLGRKDAATQGEQHAFLTSFGRTAEVYADEALAKGELVAITSETYGALQARVRSCQAVHDETEWYRVKLRILEGKNHEASRFASYLTASTTVASVLALVFLTGAAETTQSIMASLLQPMTRVLEVSFDRDEFAAVKNRPQVETQLARLAEGAKRLEEHAVSRERGFEFVARSLGRDVREAQRAYKRGDFEEARRTLHNLTDNCIACHASLPEGRQIPAPERFFATLKAKDLSPLALAHYQLVSRQFDGALDTMEGIFTAEGVERALVPLLGYFGDYLKVSIGIKNDFERPKRVLGTLLARPTTPIHLRRIFESWMMALTELPRRKPFDKPSLETARGLMSEGREQMDSSMDRSGLVHYLTAESVLQRFVRAKRDRGVAVAEAYFLLGNATSLSEHSQWISRAEFYYEAAVRMAPQAPFAVKAYGALEERLYAQAKLDGMPLDPESMFLLEELYELIDEAQGRRRKS